MPSPSLVGGHSNEVMSRAPSPSMQQAGQALHAIPPGPAAPGPRTDWEPTLFQHSTCTQRDGNPDPNTVFPQLKNKFPGMHSEISRNLSRFPVIEEGHVQCLLDTRKSSQFAQHNLHTYPFLK